MNDLISKAYAYLEFNGSFFQYEKEYKDSTTEYNKKQWQDVVDSYHKVRGYMSDESLREVFDLFINEF